MSLRVLTEPCDECPFKARLEGLRPGRLRGIVADTYAQDTHFPCHKTVDYDGPGDEPDAAGAAVCAGWLEAVGGISHAPGQLLRIAERLDAVEYVRPEVVT